MWADNMLALAQSTTMNYTENAILYAGSRGEILVPTMWADNMLAPSQAAFYVYMKSFKSRLRRILPLPAR